MRTTRCITTVMWTVAVSTPVIAAFPGSNGVIAFHSDRGGGAQLYVMQPDGSGQERVTPAGTDEVQPTWSPDGERLAFRVGDDDQDREIWVINFDGTGLRRLTFNDTEDEMPSWSPDGTKVLFVAYRDGIAQLYVMNADGSDQAILIDDDTAEYREPVWSPDGSRIAYRRQPGDGDSRELWVMNADGTNQRQLTDNRAEDEDPAWSPDGTRLAFESDRTGGKEIWVMNADGTDPVQLTSEGTDQEIAPEWSPDGTKIVFLSGRDGSSEIYVMNADGSDPTRLTTNEYDEGDPSWRPVQTTVTTVPGGTTTTTIPPTLVGGKKLLLKDDASKAEKRSLKILMKDRAISIGAGNGSVDDPTLHDGATLHVVSRRSDGFSSVYDLPAAAWKYKGKPGKNKGYKLKNAGPIKTVLVKPGKLIKVVGKGAALGHSLAGDPEPVHVALTLGTQRYCATFGGTTKFTPGKKYTAKKSGGPEACAALLPECGDEILEDGEQCPLLEGAPASPALAATRDMDRGIGVADDEVSVLDDGVEVPRSQLEVAFAPDATVDDVNGVITGIGGEIVSMVEGALILTIRIPDPGTIAGLDAIVAGLEDDPLVRFVKRGSFGATEVLPSNYGPSSFDLPLIDHLLAIDAHAAWNAVEALGTDPLTRPLVVVADYFGLGAPGAPYDLVDVDADYGTGSLNVHGYHVLGIVAASFAGSTFSAGLATGIYPATVNVRTVDGRIDATTRRTDAERDNLIIHRVRQASGPVVVNTSLGFGCTNATADFLYCNAVYAELAAVTWIEKVRGTAGVTQVGAGLESRFLHADSAGNVASSVGATETRVNDAWSAASLLPGLETLTLTGVQNVPNLTNTLAVENLHVTATEPFAPRCLSSGSKRTGHLAAIGTRVWAPVGPAGPGGNLGGTSMASPQVAGLAALVWTLDPTATPQEIAATLQATSTDPVLGAGAGCAGVPSAPVINAYAAVLATDQDIANAPVRRAILDVVDGAGAPGADGRFDERDIERFLAAFEQAAGERDYSRFDLNGDGVTGGDAGTRVDLDVNQPPSWTTVLRADQVGVSFDEHAVSDVEVLCYYAYSALYDGSEAERTSLLADGTCATVNLVVDFPTTITPGVPATLTATVGEDTSAGSVPLEDVYIELLVAGGTALPPTGMTNAQGAFQSQIDLDASSGTIEIAVRALTGPGGSVLAERRVRATAECIDASTQVELNVGNGEPDPEIDGPVLRDGTRYRVTVQGTVSIWTGEWERGVCKGAPASGVGGDTGLDAHYWFAIPVGSALCGDSFDCCPNDTGKFQMSLDGGGSFDHVEAVDETYTTSHRYDHLVTGQGDPIVFRWEESSARGDDYGIFEIRVACASETTTTTTTSTSSTTSTSTTTTSSTTIQVVTTIVVTTTTTTSTLPGGGGLFYRSYDATGPVGPTVSVLDDVRDEQVMLGSGAQLLAPVSYIGSLVPQSDAYQACWTDTGTSFAGSAAVTNLFATQNLTIGDPATVCVPVDGTLAPTNAYTCYTATGASVQSNASMSDAFVSESGDVTTPVSLCLPAEVDGSTIVGPLAALACYATTTTASATGTVPISTAIAAGDFDVGLPAGVCLPTIIQSLVPAP